MSLKQHRASFFLPPSLLPLLQAYDHDECGPEQCNSSAMLYRSCMYIHFSYALVGQVDIGK
jgi:hypothetical protein